MEKHEPKIWAAAVSIFYPDEAQSVLQLGFSEMLWILSVGRKHSAEQSAKSHAEYTAWKVDQHVEHTAGPSLIKKLNRFVQNGYGKEQKQFEKEKAVPPFANHPRRDRQKKTKAEIFDKMGQFSDHELGEDDITADFREKKIQDPLEKTALKIGLGDWIHGIVEYQ